MKDEEDSLILTQTGEANFLTLTGELVFLILIIVEQRVPKSYEYRMKVEISSFSGNLDMESFLD